MANGKTPLMRSVEKKHHRRLERLLPEMITDQGLTATARALKVNINTLVYWLRKFEIRVLRVALTPGETLEVKRIRVPAASPSD